MSERTPDQQLELFSRSLHVAGAGVAAAIVAVVFAIGYWPVAAEEIVTHKKIELARGVLDGADAVRKTNQRLHSERSMLDQRYKEVTARIPSHPDESGFLAQVTELARQSGIRVEGFRPGALRTQGRYGELEVGVTAIGEYQSLCRFLHGLPKLPRFCHLVSLDVDASNQQAVAVPLSMKLRIYFNKPQKPARVLHLQHKSGSKIEQGTDMKLMLPNASSDPRQRLKLLAIPLLGAFLIWRIWPSAAEEADSELAAAPQVATPSAGVPTPASSKASLPPVPEWTLEDALRFDPLKKLTVRVEPSEDLVSPSTEDAADDNARMEQAAFEERVAALESLKVDAILVNDAGAAALVGSRIVRVGDYLAEGARVIDVTADGIRLRLEAEDAVQPSTAAEFVAKPRH